MYCRCENQEWSVHSRHVIILIFLISYNIQEKVTPTIETFEEFNLSCF